MNPERGYVTLPVGGKERTFRLDLNAMVLFQRETGVASFAAYLEIMKDSRSLLDNPAYCRALLWASQVGEREPINTVGSWFGIDDAPVLFENVLAIVLAALPTAKQPNGEAAGDADPSKATAAPTAGMN
jgi:hypothetical protein